MVTNVKWEFELVKVDYITDLVLNINFKLKGKFFRIKKSKVIASSFWIGKGKKYINYDEFEKDMYSYLEDNEKVKKEIESIMLEYFKLHRIKEERKNEIKKINKLIKNSKNEINLNII